MRGTKSALCIAVIACAAVICIAAPQASADTRSYVWTYEYGTEAKGSAEAEYYLTMEHGKLGEEARGTRYQHQIELEYGITDHLDVGMYQMLRKEGGESPEYEGFKLKTRYRIGERGEYPVDPELYLEYENTRGGKEALEMKLILAKDLGQLNIAYNQIAEITLGRGGGVEHEFAAGISYPLFGPFRAGIESTGSYTEHELAVGPTVSWAGGRYWANAGALFGLNRNTVNTQIRLLVAVHF